MNQLFKLIRNIGVGSLFLTVLTGCDSLYDDLPPCPSPGAEISFTYTQNMDFQDYFSSEVHCIDLYIFKVTETKADEDYSTHLYAAYHDEDRQASGTVSVNIDLEPGKYQAVVYGGMSCTQSSFAFKNLFDDDEDISIEDLEVGLNKNYYFDDSVETGDYEDDDIDHSALELHDHFYGISNVFDVDAAGYTPIVIDVMKNTNILNFYVVDKDRAQLEANDYRMYVIDDNNEMGSDNLLIDSDDIVYRPYIKANSVHPDDSDWPAMQASFSVSKLSTRRNPRFAVINKELGNDKPLFYQEIKQKLLDAKDAYAEASSMSDQEFLNRQNEWTIITAIDVVKNTWVSVTVKVGDWEIRYDNPEF